MELIGVEENQNLFILKISKKGCCRVVVLVGNYAIKIPTFFNMKLFLYGCYCNWSERNFCKMFKGVDENVFYNLVAPSLFCSWFGLIQIQKRCVELDRHLTRKEKYKFKDTCGGDYKKENFGYYNNKIVCVDYP